MNTCKNCIHYSEEFYPDENYCENYCYYHDKACFNYMNPCSDHSTTYPYHYYLFISDEDSAIIIKATSLDEAYDIREAYDYQAYSYYRIIPNDQINETCNSWIDIIE